MTIAKVLPMRPWQIIESDCLEALRAMDAASIDAIVCDPPAGITFMGKDWDHDKGGRAHWIAWLTSVMRECLRVLKPGGHALVWALPRTSHWTATAVEDAGFELRDCITHVFGSGFPKSLDVSKAIDKAAGAEREVVGFTHHPDGRPRNVVHRDVGVYGGGQTKNGIGLPVTAPATEAARQWDGFGTALKPASEHWWLARKPLEGTVAECVQAHGTGALNIDGCRVGTGGQLKWERPRDMGFHGWTDSGACAALESSGGRWPPNLLLSHDHTEDAPCSPECPVAMVDSQSEASGMHGSGHAMRGVMAGQYRPSSFDLGDVRPVFRYGDDHNGTCASRFFPVFYCPKASRRDRGAGNMHPTVKNTALMAWLCRLITPPGGAVLDPFAGSGSTLVAAVREGFRCIGIEQSPEYCDIARKRLGAPARARKPLASSQTASASLRPVQLDLYEAIGFAP